MKNQLGRTCLLCSSCIVTSSSPEWVDIARFKQFIRPIRTSHYCYVVVTDGHSCVLLGPSAMVDGRWRRSRRNRPEKEEGKAPPISIPGKGSFSHQLASWKGAPELLAYNHILVCARLPRPVQAHKLCLQMKHRFVSYRQCNYKIARNGKMYRPEWYCHPNIVWEICSHSHFQSYLLSLAM